MGRYNKVHSTPTRVENISIQYRTIHKIMHACTTDNALYKRNLAKLIYNIYFVKLPTPHQNTSTFFTKKNIMSATCDIQSAKQYLTNAHWPAGLQNQLIQSTGQIALRFFIVGSSVVSLY